MTIFEAIVLGIVQGLTEFLPVSSSGHLVLAQQVLGWQEPNLSFDVALHFATLLAVGVYFFSEILKLKRQELIAIVVGTIPAVFVGLLFKDVIESVFASVFLVSLALIVTGVLNLLADRFLDKSVKNKLEESSKALPGKEISWQDGLFIGCFQALAITPGISRSGSTVFAGLYRKLDRVAAFRFSFILSLPAVGGAALLQLFDAYQEGFTGITPLPFLLGSISAFVVGLLSLAVFKYVIVKARFEWFGYYCLLLGGGSLVFSLV